MLSPISATFDPYDNGMAPPSANEDSFLYGLNNNGQAIGYSETGVGPYPGFIWQNGAFTNLGSRYTPYAINNNGAVAGTNPSGNGFFRSASGTVTSFQPLQSQGGYDVDGPLGINDNGVVVGTFDNANGYYPFVRASDGTVTNLGPIIQSYGYTGIGYAQAVNNNGLVLGYSDYDSYNGIPDAGYVYNMNTGNVTFLPGSTIYPQSVNNSGQICGGECDLYVQRGRKPGVGDFPELQPDQHKQPRAGRWQHTGAALPARTCIATARRSTLARASLPPRTPKWEVLMAVRVRSPSTTRVKSSWTWAGAIRANPIC